MPSESCRTSVIYTSKRIAFKFTLSRLPKIYAAQKYNYARHAACRQLNFS